MGKRWFHNYYKFHQIKGTNIFEMSLLCSLNKCFNRSVFLEHSIFVKISVYCLVWSFFFFLLFTETQKRKSVIFYTLSCCSKPVWLLNFKILYCSMLYCSCKDYFMVLFFIIELPLCGKEQREHSSKLLLLCSTNAIQLWNNMKLKWGFIFQI